MTTTSHLYFRTTNAATSCKIRPMYGTEAPTVLGARSKIFFCSSSYDSISTALCFLFCPQFGRAVDLLRPLPGGAGIALKLRDGSEVEASVVVGADGVRSAVACHLQLPGPNYAGYAAYRWVSAHARLGRRHAVHALRCSICVNCMRCL